jgi:hypothetical protein
VWRVVVVGDSKDGDATAKGPTLLGDFVHFLKHEKKWWLTPIVILGFIFVASLFFSGSSFGNYIYATW